MSTRRYAIVTPARNEAANIEQTLASMAAQTLAPLQWVIVDDGSTDATAAIVRRYAELYPFIKLLSVTGDGKANFGSKVRAFQAGFEALDAMNYDYIGNLDGDVSFAADYFERLLGRMDADDRLGLAGGFIMEKIDGQFLPRRVNLQSVAGAVQLFRREAYEKIGGYRPQRRGGIDTVAEIMVRMHGWQARTYRDLEVKHHGRVLTGGRNVCLSRFNMGIVNRQLGYHPLFHTLMGLRRMADPPLAAGGLMLAAGYFWAAASGKPYSVPGDFVSFLRREQRERMKRYLLRRGAGLESARTQP